MDVMTRPTRHYDVQFVLTQRNGDIPVVSGYPFLAKDSGRILYRRKTRSCKATILLHSDTTGTYNEGTPSHNRPPHGEFINEMKRRMSMKIQTTSVGNVDVAARTIASSIREKDATEQRVDGDGEGCEAGAGVR